MPLPDQRNTPDLDQNALQHLLHLIYESYGYDFRRYALQSLQRRILRILEMYAIPTVHDLINKLQEDDYFFHKFITEVTVGVTEMFRDPLAWKYFKDHVVPVLRELPQVRVWHAGCSTGEEIFSMSILLKEVGLLDRAVQVATDINPNSLAMAQRGLYSTRKIDLYQKNYSLYGGNRVFSDYYTLEGNNMQMKPGLLDKCTFRLHNLVQGEKIDDFDLIFCRNVLIYFDQDLQEDVLSLFHQSLTPGGYMMLGNYESLLWNNRSKNFSVISNDYNLLRKVK